MLKNELKQLVEAELRKRGEEITANARRKLETEIFEDRQAATTLIRNLPALLAKVAKEGVSVTSVLRLRPGLHCDNDIDKVVAEFALHGCDSNVLRHGALEIAVWLAKPANGLKVEVVRICKSEPEQGRPLWYELHLTASWGE